VVAIPWPPSNGVLLTKPSFTDRTRNLSQKTLPRLTPTPTRPETLTVTRRTGLRPRGVHVCDPPTTVAARLRAALETRCKQSPQARGHRREARSKSRSSVECSSHATSLWNPFSDSLLNPTDQSAERQRWLRQAAPARHTERGRGDLCFTGRRYRPEAGSAGSRRGRTRRRAACCCRCC
jgi:hypothetical protein